MNENKKGEAIVLGELKKEKSSKPVFVFLVLVAIIAMLWFMPQIQDYFNQGTGTIPELYRSTIGRLINGEEYVEEEEDTTPVVEEPILLAEGVTLNKLVITISNISIAEGKINYTITSKTDINLDNGNYNIEIYNSNKELLGKVKLTGTASTTADTRTVDLSFTAQSESYYLKLTN